MLTILLDQEAIEEAITNYISEDALNVDLSEKDVSIKLTMGRGNNGLRAKVNVSEPEGNSAEEEAETETEIPTVTEDAAEEPAVGPFD